MSFLRKYGAFLVLSFLLWGCVTTPKTLEREPIYLGEIPDFENIKSFSKMIETLPGTPEYEKARINYLLERLAKSPYNFVRNQKTHSGLRVMVHLKWKYRRFHQDVSTAEAFIARVATRSKRTGRLYLCKVSDQEIYPLRDVLADELKLVDQAFLEHQEKIKEGFEKIQASREASSKKEEMALKKPGEIEKRVLDDKDQLEISS